MNDTILEAQMLTIRAGNGSLDKGDLASVASELKRIAKSLLNLMNSQSEGGNTFSLAIKTIFKLIHLIAPMANTNIKAIKANTK